MASKFNIGDTFKKVDSFRNDMINKPYFRTK